jgi:mevalonate kinase
VYRHILAKKNCDETVHAEISTDGILKGMGGSASVCASFAAALFTYLHLKYSPEEIFEAVQAGEEVAHGGRPSGIDAITVLSGAPQKFCKQFEPVKYVSEPFNAELPEATTLLVIDSYKGERDTTGNLIARFAASNGIGKKPDELGQTEREKLLMPYQKILDSALGELRKEGDAVALGKLMDANHGLLKSVSTDEIEKARELALSAGALGSKLTGAGGKGGAVLALVRKAELEKVQAALVGAGFPCFEAQIARRGVVLSQS